MADNPVAEQLVLFGGTGGGAPMQDTWSWNGTNWKPRIT